MTYTVYQHRNLNTNKIFYVGKGLNSRAYNFKKRTDIWKTVYLHNPIKAEILFKTDDNELALFMESEIIDLYRKRNYLLVNQKSSGCDNSGYKHTAEHIEKLRGNKFGAHTGFYSFKGKHHSEEQKAKWSVDRKGIDNGKWKGKKKPESTKEKISLAKLGIPNAKQALLNVQQVKEIHALLGTIPLHHIALKFNVGDSTIRRIRDGENLTYKAMLNGL